MKKDEKQHIVEEFIGIFDKPGVYLMDFKGLDVAEITELRSNLRQANVSMKVVKNTLAKRALDEAGIKGLDSFLVGPTGVVWSQEDSITPARILLDFLKKHEKGTVKAGIVDGSVFGESDIKTISKLPTKQELYANVASALNAPMVKLAQTLNAVPVKFVRTIVALKDKMSETTEVT